MLELFQPPDGPVIPQLFPCKFVGPRFVYTNHYCHLRPCDVERLLRIVTWKMPLGKGSLQRGRSESGQIKTRSLKTSRELPDRPDKAYSLEVWALRAAPSPFWPSNARLLFFLTWLWGCCFLGLPWSGERGIGIRQVKIPPGLLPLPTSCPWIKVSTNCRKSLTNFQSCQKIHFLRSFLLVFLLLL